MSQTGGGCRAGPLAGSCLRCVCVCVLKRSCDSAGSLATVLTGRVTLTAGSSVDGDSSQTSFIALRLRLTRTQTRRQSLTLSHTHTHTHTHIHTPNTPEHTPTSSSFTLLSLSSWCPAWFVSRCFSLMRARCLEGRGVCANVCYLCVDTFLLLAKVVRTFQKAPYNVKRLF